MKQRIIALCILIAGTLLGYFVYMSEPALRASTSTASSTSFIKDKPFKLGLDLAGGTRLVYKADISNVQGSSADAMNALRDVIERRVNLFGVGEPVVQTEKSSLANRSNWTRRRSD